MRLDSHDFDFVLVPILLVYTYEYKLNMYSKIILMKYMNNSLSPSFDSRAVGSSGRRPFRPVVGESEIGILSEHAQHDPAQAVKDAVEISVAEEVRQHNYNVVKSVSEQGTIYYSVA